MTSIVWVALIGETWTPPPVAVLSKEAHELVVLESQIVSGIIAVLVFVLIMGASARDE